MPIGRSGKKSGGGLIKAVVGPATILLVLILLGFYISHHQELIGRATNGSQTKVGGAGASSKSIRAAEKLDAGGEKPTIIPSPTRIKDDGVLLNEEKDSNKTDRDGGHHHHHHHHHSHKHHHHHHKHHHEDEKEDDGERQVQDHASDNGKKEVSSNVKVAKNCSDFDHFHPGQTVDLVAKLKKVLDEKGKVLSPILLSQLSNYAKKVHEKLADRNKKLWAPYLTAPSPKRTKCFSKFPECALFRRSDVINELLETFENKDLTDIARYGNMTMANGFEKLAAEGGLNSGGKSKKVSGKPSSFLPAALRAASFMLRKCCIEHSELHAALEYVSMKLQRAKIPSWLTAGSLLGAVREEGTLIPWDTDVDLCVRPEDEKAISALFTAGSPSGKANAGATKGTEENEGKFYKEYSKEHAHGKILGVVYGTSKFRHEEASRVELWVRQESRKMQKAALTFPLVECGLYNLEGIHCPHASLEVLERGYGPNWCRPCKHKTSSCKGVELD